MCKTRKQRIKLCLQFIQARHAKLENHPHILGPPSQSYSHTILFLLPPFYLASLTEHFFFYIKLLEFTNIVILFMICFVEKTNGQRCYTKLLVISKPGQEKRSKLRRHASCHLPVGCDALATIIGRTKYLERPRSTIRACTHFSHILPI